MKEQQTVYIIPVDYILHTDDHPFCFSDPACPCHEDQEAIQTVNAWVLQGLMTEQEATLYISGQTFDRGSI